MRKKRKAFFRMGFKRSLIFHGIVFALLFLNSWIQDSPISKIFMSKKEITEDLQKKAIRVDLVDLPDLKVAELSKVDLSKKVGPEARKKDKKTDAMVYAEKKKKEAEAKKQAEERKKALAEKRREEEQDRLEKLRNKLRQAGKEIKKEEEEGRQAMKGNIISEGFSATGDVASQKDAFQAEIRSHFTKYWEAPAWMRASEKYRAKILVKIAPDGRVLEKDFLAKSGHEDFDSLAMKAIDNANPFPVPPEDLIRNVMEEGIVCAFPD